MMEIHEALRRRMKTGMAIGESKKFARRVLYEGEADLKLCNSLNTIIPLEEMLTQFFNKTLSF